MKFLALLSGTSLLNTARISPAEGLQAILYEWRDKSRRSLDVAGACARACVGIKWHA